MRVERDLKTSKFCIVADDGTVIHGPRYNTRRAAEHAAEHLRKPREVRSGRIRQAGKRHD